MAKWFRGIVMLGAALLVTHTALAQTSPSQLEFALEALSQNAGQTVTEADLDGWQWSQTNYPDTSLGCPQPGQVYSQVVTSGYQFLLVYQGQTYDFRVSDDGSTVVLCTSAQLGTPVAPPTVTPTPPAVEPTLLPPTATGCPEGLGLRLTVGEQGRVTGDVPSNIRASADVASEQLGQLQPGEIFTVTGDAVCGPDGLYWWQIQAGDLSGWVAQGDAGLYYVEPVPQPLPAENTLAPLIAENITRLVQLSRIDSNLQGAVAWSPDGTTLAVGNSNEVVGGVWLYDVAQLQNPPAYLETGTLVTAVAFTPDSAFLILGDVDGNVEFWQPGAEEPAFSFAAHGVAVQSLSVSPNGLILATVGADNTVRFWGVPVPPEG